MNRQHWGLLFKVLAISILISMGIKYGGNLLPLSATSITALALILLPTLILGVIFTWRSIH